MELEQGLKSLVLARLRLAEGGQRLAVHRVVHQDLDLEVDGALGALGEVKVQVAEDQVEALLLDHQLVAIALDGHTGPLLHQAQPGAVHCAGHWKESKKAVSSELPSALGHFPAERRRLLSVFLQETPGKLLERELGGPTWRWGVDNSTYLLSSQETQCRETHECSSPLFPHLAFEGNL